MPRSDHQLEITIGTDGEVEIDVQGLEGPDCVRQTREIENAIGKVVDRKKKDSYYRRGHNRREGRVTT